MSLEVYRDQILEPIAKPWLERGDNFVLEEDNDSGHGRGDLKGGNIVKTWKENNKLEHYFNYSGSPDLAPIENCWRPPKQFLQHFPHWDEFEICNLAVEGWGTVTQRCNGLSPVGHANSAVQPEALLRNRLNPIDGRNSAWQDLGATSPLASADGVV
ncbi:hypothetical protein EJ02DRAFT_476471 [Clathrospora elynae]|uniref:Tc1-like transposase DDE domain-containing protein n=1 Tax=Clathrospora elynae TaxID=706981 RepID=A0A6A5T0W9_9PLEO|nr:hypothetical protein EJ02DRAFT_476471 [Clathrospora elynae]